MAHGETGSGPALDRFRFDDRFVSTLPMDPSQEVRPRQVVGAAGSFVPPTRVAQPQLIAHSAEMTELLGFTPDDVATPEFAEVFAGNRLLPGMRPWSACYGGHQFGNWAGQLGDGRAITLGELNDSGGQRWELQLKGAGLTPYSRGADGRAVMRSSVREFLCSEAMFHLGVPTTRALSLVSTGDEVVRDMFYDGNPRPEPGAIVCRVAPSFLRLGNYQIFASRRDVDTQRQLVAWTIGELFPELIRAGEVCRPDGVSPELVVRWFAEVTRRTARLMVEWMRVGFVHGVMNTDNLSILGQTIDYGPYGWLEGFDFEWTPNTTDAHGRRYAYGQQPQVGFWNLVQFGSALVGLLVRGDVGSTSQQAAEDAAAPLNEALEVFKTTFSSGHEAMMAAKLGLEELGSGDDDQRFVTQLFETLQLVETDMTLWYRALAEFPVDEDASADDRLDVMAVSFYAPPGGDQRNAIDRWLSAYAERARGVDPERRAERMAAANPKYVLRNYLAQLAIDDAEKGDGAATMELLEVLRRPYDEQPDRDAKYAQKRPEWARNRPGCSMLSCSS